MTCTTCGQENPEGFRFCGRCGSPLTRETEQRRKPATLIFCDASGSTAMGEQLDAEAVRELMFVYFHEMRSSIERHGGTVEKFVGDAVMAVFGVPEAHEDPLRACRAAFEMQRRLSRLNEQLERRYGSSLALRIGVIEATDMLNVKGRVLSDLGEVLLLAGRPDEAARILAEAARLYDQKGNLPSAERARRLAEDLTARARGGASL